MVWQSPKRIKPSGVVTMEKQHFEILLENMELNIKMMHEGFAGLSDTIKAESAERKAENKFLDEKISALSNRIGSVETNLNAKIDSVETNLNARIDSVEANLGARIDSVEANLGARIDAMHSELIDHRNNSEMHRAPRRSSIKKAA
jgi:hypothetical protein